MGIKHAATKTSGERGLANEWNDDHIQDGDHDCNQYQHLQHVIENLDAFPPGPVEGQIVHRSDENKTYVYNGTEWIEISKGGTKEFFYHAVVGNASIGGTSYSHQYYPCVRVADGEVAFINLYVPYDFKSLISTAVVFIPVNNANPARLDVDIQHASAGEQFNNHIASGIYPGLNLVQDEITELDFTGDFTVLGAGDYIGVLVFNDTGVNLDFLGVRMKYE